MSEEQNGSGSGGPDQSQPETPCTPSGGQSEDLELSVSRLTVENVQRLQGDYAAAISSLARQSVEAYLLSSENEANQDGRREPNLPYETEPEARSAGPLGEESAENDGESFEKISNPDFQTRSLTSSAPETKKREFADLETQTEWSYSSTSQGSREKARRTPGQRTTKKEMRSEESKVRSGRIMGTLEAERSDTTEKGSLVGSSEAGMADTVLDSLLMVEEHHITEFCHLGYCEFCSAVLKPFPTPEELEDMPERMESVPCCRTYKEILRCVIEELMATQTLEGAIDITPHRRLSQAILNCKIRSLIMEELQEHGIENYKEVFERYMKLGPWVKVGYKLSDHAPKQPPVAAKKRLHAKDLLKIDPEFKPEQAKLCHPFKPVRKYYPDGKIFLLLLPDGTGQVYYPSGNIAILITYLKAIQFTYIILADGPHKTLMAFFTNQGYAACYCPDGSLRVQLGLCQGSSFDDRGIPEKRWSWWDATHHVHAPPFQPLSIQLNSYIQVKMRAQDQISLTFAKLHNCIRLNVGARLKLKDPSMLPLLQSSANQKAPVSQATTLQIKTLLVKLREALRVTCSSPSKQTMPFDLVALILSRLKRWQQKTLI